LRSFFLLQRAGSKDRKGLEARIGHPRSKVQTSGIAANNKGSGAFEPLLSRLVLHLLMVKLHV